MSSVQLSILPVSSKIIVKNLEHLISPLTGYPDSLHFADFRRQFEVLRVAPLSVEDDRETEFDEREVGHLSLHLDGLHDGGHFSVNTPPCTSHPFLHAACYRL